MMACDGSSKPEFVQVQVARCHKISSLESPKIFSKFLRSTTIRALEVALTGGLLSKNGQYGRPMLGCPSLPRGQSSTNPIIS